MDNEKMLLGLMPQLECCIQVSWNKTSKTGESAAKSHKHDAGLQALELRGRVEKKWTNNTGERRSRGDLMKAYDSITGKEPMQWRRFFELASLKVSRGQR